ncbi:tyrosine-type recombinase/integrase [Intestinibaculum porci]|uniref:tyrosine-type recombinase/integrase n=1 Tax=Intestinibaculum porci TaxID=2487118 RepID=UPI002409EB42|nr:tyrosine-type recombinase/integrase [Intestinibaculum porci]MDD6348551.1 tyrosine-type recombinase/integrase [Intestinibaculum porci]
MKKEVKAFVYRGMQVKEKRLRNKKKSYYVSIRRNGKTKTITARTPEELKTKMDDFFNGNHDEVQTEEEIQKGSDTFSEVWKIFLNQRNGKVQTNTYSHYLSTYKTYLSYFADYKMNDITAKEVSRFVTIRLNGLKKWTVTTATRILFTFLRWAYCNGFKDDLITKGDISALWETRSIAQQETPVIHTMTIEEYEAYKKIYLQKRCGGDLMIACDLCFYAGLRISEAIGLRYGDIVKAGDGWVVNVRQKASIALDENGHKTMVFSTTLKSANSKRTIPIPNWLAAECIRRGVDSKQPGDVLLDKLNICNVDSYHAIINNRIRRDNIKRPEEEQIKAITIHELRKSFLTRCALSGMDTYTLQKIAGHDSIETTLQYYIGISDVQAADKARTYLEIG